GTHSTDQSDEDDTELLNRSKALRHGLRERAQGLLDFWRDWTERADHLQQEMKDAREDSAKDRKEFQERWTRDVSEFHQIKKEIAEICEESERKAIEHRRISKAQDQRIHEAQVEYRELRRANRRAGLR
ncbi:hypothetical protein DENSPDRAFT_845504, partial [Dentipellis sp. KUC8613]